MSKMWFWQDSQVGYAYLPKVRWQDATHWRRRVLDMKILAYIYLFDILLKITSPRLNGLTNLIFNLHAKDIHDFFNRR